jgi:hypothetical protein
VEAAVARISSYDAAQRHAHELAPQPFGDRLSQRGLARPGRTDETQDRLALLLTRQAADGNVFEDPLLGLAQAVMPPVEHF